MGWGATPSLLPPPPSLLIPSISPEPLRKRGEPLLSSVPYRRDLIGSRIFIKKSLRSECHAPTDPVDTTRITKKKGVTIPMHMFDGQKSEICKPFKILSHQKQLTSAI